MAVIQLECSKFLCSLTQKLTAYLDTYKMHCNLLPVISQCLPIFDELCRRFLNFARSCIVRECSLIRFIANYGIVPARNGSPVGRNLLYCLKRYNFTYENVLPGSFNSTHL